MTLISEQWLNSQGAIQQSNVVSLSARKAERQSSSFSLGKKKIKLDELNRLRFVSQEEDIAIKEQSFIRAADFINKLIQRKTGKRLGVKGALEVKAHPWLSDFNWDALYIGAMPSPYIPKNEDNFDPRVTGDWKDEIDSSLQTENIQTLFGDYFYDHNLCGK